MNKVQTLFALLAVACQLLAQNSITIDTQTSLGKVSPGIFGQFIEYMGRDIEGGIYDPQSTLSDANGIRQDVLAKAKELAPTMIRFPGGTFVKTFHWMDGVGPRSERRSSKNLIWGGINTFQFGTCEFIEYCRAIGCEPVLVVNIATGTPDEAANWVEYCNGTDNTYYANLRRSHGYPEPFNVKYWALGNEEAAEPDAGRHQDPQKYVTDVWHFIKLMKENSQDSVTTWKKWYRFPARQQPLRVALDEWGIWEYQDPPYGTTNTYEWRHALATAYFMNTILRCADFVGMANWAQMVNILAPIMTNGQTSIRQTVFYPLREYRAHTLGEMVKVEATSPAVDGDLQALNAVCSIDRTSGELTLFVVNLSPMAVKAQLAIDGSDKALVQEVTTLTAERLDAKNVLSAPDKDVVSVKIEKPGKRLRDFTFAPESIQILHIKP